MTLGEAGAALPMPALGAVSGIGIDSVPTGGWNISSDVRQLLLELGGAAVPIGPAAPGTGSAQRPSRRRRTAGVPTNPDAAALLLDKHEDFRVLRRLRPRPITVPRPLALGERIAVIVDTETTGLDHRHDEVIELGTATFIQDLEGDVSDVIGVFSALQEPSRPNPPEITWLTGLDDASVAG